MYDATLVIHILKVKCIRNVLYDVIIIIIAVFVVVLIIIIIGYKLTKAYSQFLQLIMHDL